MYQEIIEPKRGKISDALMIVICVVLIFVLEAVAVALRNVAQVPVMIFQFFFIAALIGFCIWYYKNRLRSIKCIYITKDTERFGELESVPDPFVKFGDGALFVESLVGATGSFVAAVERSQMCDFYEREAKQKPRQALRLNAKMNIDEKVYCLVFEQENTVFELEFQPSEKLAQAIKEGIENGNNAGV